MKNWEDFEPQTLALFVTLVIVGVPIFVGVVLSLDETPISLSETEELLSDIRNNSNDREIMDCARLHLQAKEEIFKDDTRNFYDCKKRVLQERLKRSISESPDAKN